MEEKKDEDKMDIDVTLDVERTIESCRKLASSNFPKAIAELLVIEKQTRLAKQGENTTKIIVEIVTLCGKHGHWKELNEHVVILSKKRSQIKQAISRMVQECMKFIDSTPDLDTRISLIQALMKISEGKIYVEVERANLIRMLSKIRENQGDINSAADLLSDVQIETIGSMEEKDKIEFILESMRLTLLKKDFIRTYIIGKKITSRAISKKGYETLKVRYYNLLIEYWLVKKNYLEVCRCYYNIFNTPGIKNQHEIMGYLALFVVLAAHDNEQSDIINRVFREKILQESKMNVFYEAVKMFIKTELISWKRWQADKDLSKILTHRVFKNRERVTVLRERIIEHNLRVIAKYYSKIKVHRLTFLLEAKNIDETELFISKLVTGGIIKAKIDRIDETVSFRTKRHVDEILNEWNTEVTSIFSLLTKSSHVIGKELMLAEGRKKEISGKKDVK